MSANIFLLQNQFIFDNLIDTQRVYNFPIEIDVSNAFKCVIFVFVLCCVVFYHVSLRLQVPIERKKKYVMIRKEVSGENGGELSEISTSVLTTCLEG